MQRWISLFTAGLLYVLPLSAPAETRLSWELVESYPHDRGAFTQGLLFHDGKLYESTGRYGQSELREVDLESGRVLRKRRLARSDFGEGLARVGNELVQLTWTSGHAYRWRLQTFELLETLPYQFAQGGKRARGWGLCYNGQQLVLSDGSDQLYFLDPENHAVIRQIGVQRNGRSLSRINELECVNDQVYANIWLRDEIVIIDPQSGKVTASVDLTSLYPKQQRRSADDVLNGIAWDKERKRLFVTGKLWPRIYQIAISGIPD